jgi:hypothetical protein
VCTLAERVAVTVGRDSDAERRLRVTEPVDSLASRLTGAPARFRRSASARLRLFSRLIGALASAH